MRMLAAQLSLRAWRLHISYIFGCRGRVNIRCARSLGLLMWIPQLNELAPPSARTCTILLFSFLYMITFGSHCLGAAIGSFAGASSSSLPEIDSDDVELKVTFLLAFFKQQARIHWLQRGVSSKLPSCLTSWNRDRKFQYGYFATLSRILVVDANSRSG